MTNFNKAKHLPSGNNENESENQRNSQQKNKNFMSPTISASSKLTTTTPTNKKKLFSEWKSPNSNPAKTGNSNSILRKSLPKPPSFNTPKLAVNSNKNNDERDEFEHDSFDVPYDPLTNYLSPRPKFLRYRPERKREFLVNWEGKSGSESDNGSVGDCDDSLVEKESEEIEISDKNSVVDEENEDMDELYEVKLGFKWVLLKILIVVFGLFLSTICICSMNSSYEGFKIGDEHVMNSSLRIVSLRNLASRNWVLDGKPRSMMSVFENDHSMVTFVEKLGRIDKSSEKTEHSMNMNMSLRIVSLSSLNSGNRVLDEKTRSMKGVFDINHSTLEFDEKVGNVEQINDTVVVKEIEFPKRIESLDDYYQIQGQLEFDEKLGRVDQISDITEADEIEISEKIESSDVLNQIQSQSQNETDVPDRQVDIEVPKVGIPNSKNEHEQVETEAPTVAIELVEGTGIEDVVGFNATLSGLELENEVENATENSVVKPKEKELANEVGAFPENQSETVELGPTMKGKPSELVEYNHLRLTSRDLIWSALSPLLLAFGLLSFCVLKFYGKCKRSSSKTRSSSVKFCSSVEKTTKSRHGLPPKSMEKTDQHQLNAPLVEKDFHSEMNPLPINVNPQENFDRDTHIIIPKVKQTGEFEVGVEFTQSLKSCVRSEMELKDESVFSTPETKVIRRSSVSGRPSIVQPSSLELSTAESFSCGSYISQDMTSMRDGKEEISKATPTPRRSTRLRNKGVTSP